MSEAIVRESRAMLILGLRATSIVMSVVMSGSMAVMRSVAMRVLIIIIVRSAVMSELMIVVRNIVMSRSAVMSLQFDLLSCLMTETSIMCTRRADAVENAVVVVVAVSSIKIWVLSCAAMAERRTVRRPETDVDKGPRSIVLVYLDERDKEKIEAKRAAFAERNVVQY